VRTGLLWKIPLIGALRLATPHFAKRGSFMGFLKIPLKSERLSHEGKQEQSLISFLLQTSVSLSYLLFNLMSKELFGET